MEGQITIRVDQVLLDQIDRDAKDSERTRAQIVRLIIKKHYRESGIDVDALAPEAPGEEGTPPGSEKSQDDPPEGDDGIPF